MMTIPILVTLFAATTSPDETFIGIKYLKRECPICKVTQVRKIEDKIVFAYITPLGVPFVVAKRDPDTNDYLPRERIFREIATGTIIPIQLQLNVERIKQKRFRCINRHRFQIYIRHYDYNDRVRRFLRY